jgi:hypothetical protein
MSVPGRHRRGWRPRLNVIPLIEIVTGAGFAGRQYRAAGKRRASPARRGRHRERIAFLRKSAFRS